MRETSSQHEPPSPYRRPRTAGLGRSAPRSRLGCVNCKQRHVRCDETQPSCENCARLKLNCHYRNLHKRGLVESAPVKTLLRAQRTNKASSSQPTWHSEARGSEGTQTAPVSHPGQGMGTSPSPGRLGGDADKLIDAGRYAPARLDDAWNANLQTLVTPDCSLLLEPGLVLGDSADMITAGAADHEDQPSLDSWVSFTSWLSHQDFHQGPVPGHHQPTAPHGQQLLSSWAGDSRVSHQEGTSPAKSDEATAGLVTTIACESNTIVPGSSPQQPPSTPRGDETGAGHPDAEDNQQLIEAFKRIIHPPGGVLIGGVRRWRRLQRYLVQLSSCDLAVMNSLLSVSELFSHSMENTHEISQDVEDRIKCRHLAAKNELQQRTRLMQSGKAAAADDMLAIVFLLAWFHVLRDRGKSDSGALAFPSSETNRIITASTTWNWYSKQLLGWFNVLDARATHLGDGFLLSAKALQTVSYYPLQVIDNDYERDKQEEGPVYPIDLVASPSTSPRPASTSRPPEYRLDSGPLNPPLTACDIKQITLRFVIQPGVDWYLRSIAFYRQIAALTKHHRARFTPDDEYEVILASKRIEKDLWELWAQRPSAISLSPAELAMSVSPDVAMTSAEVFRVHLATFWSLFIYLHRVSWWHLGHSKTASKALDETWNQLQASYGELTVGGLRRIIHPSVMWPVFILGVETKDPRRQTWAADQLAALGDTRRSHDIDSDSDAPGTLPGFRISYGATRNATRASMLLRTVVEKQNSLGRRIDELDLARETFGRGFSLV